MTFTKRTLATLMGATALIGCEMQSVDGKPVKSQLVAGDDIIPFCRNEGVKPNVYGYIDFDGLPSASFEDVTDFIKSDARRDVYETPNAPHIVPGVSQIQRACKSELPLNSQRYWVYQKGTGLKPHARYEIFVSNGRVFQIDGFYRSNQKARDYQEVLDVESRG